MLEPIQLGLRQDEEIDAECKNFDVLLLAGTDRRSSSFTCKQYRQTYTNFDVYHYLYDTKAGHRALGLSICLNKKHCTGTESIPSQHPMISSWQDVWGQYA